MKETINNNAYLHSCNCPTCNTHLHRGWEEENFYCYKCGEHLHAPAFTDEEIKKAIFDLEMDNYED